MKKLYLLLFATLPFFSCQDDNFNGLFRLPITNLSFSVDPSIQPPGTYYIPINNVLTNTQNLMAENGLDIADLDAIIPYRATLSVVFQDAKIDFIRNMSIRLCPIGENQPNCGREAFWRENIPFNTSFELGLNGSDVDDLSDVLLANEINVQVKLEELYSQPSGSFNIVLDMEFEVR